MDREEIEQVVKLTVDKTVPSAMEHMFEHYGFETEPRKSQKLQAFLASLYAFSTSMFTRVLTVVILTALAAVATWAFGTGKIGG